jgi:hypothetical protein
MSELMYQKYGMDLLRPAQTGYIAGSMFSFRVLEKHGNGRVLSPTGWCGPRGPAAVTLSAMPGNSAEGFTFTYEVSSNNEAKAEVAQIADVGANINYIDKVSVSFKNVKVIRPEDSLLAQARNTRSDCRLNKTQITALLQADVDTETSFKVDAGLTATQKQAIKGVVDASFTGKSSITRNDSSSEKALFYGVQIRPDDRE